MTRVLALALCLTIFPVGAEACVCGLCENIVANLNLKHGEVVKSVGVFRKGMTIVETLEGPKGSFTILATTPNGYSCIVTFGTNMHHSSSSIPGERADP